MRVDFYLLSAENDASFWLIACRLVEIAYRRKHRVFVFCADEAAAHSMDELLWTFKPESFIPHNLQGEGPNVPPPVQIGYVRAPDHNDILLNLSGSMPPFAFAFSRVIEIVSAEETQKAQSRLHFSQYRAKGAAVHIHHLAPAPVLG